MDILIKIPSEKDEEYKAELFKMFKLICDNIDTNGLECKVSCGKL